MLDQPKPTTPRGKPRNTKPGRPPFLADPRKERPGEKIGGRFFEHPSREAAEAERDRLAVKHPGETFVIGEVP